MFEKIKQKIKQAIENAKDFQEQTESRLAEHFNDEIAIKTQWSALKRGGSNFKTHNLIQQSSMVLKYQMSIGGKLFIGTFGLIGIATLLAGLYFIFVHSDNTGFFLALFGLTFSIVSMVLFASLGKPTFLDRSVGMMYKGNKPPKLSGIHNDKEVLYLNDVYAIQIIKEYVRSDKSSYYSYEINFVMKDATRINIIDHGNYKQIKKDAKTISQFIVKPIWDSVNLS